MNERLFNFMGYTDFCVVHTALLFNFTLGISIMIKKIICISAFALSISLSQSTLACHNHSAYLTSERYENMTKELNLTADQKNKIKAIRMESREKMKSEVKEMRKNRMKINELTIADVLDEAKVNKLISEQKELMGSIIKMRVMTKHDISKVLTAKQKTMLETKMKQWHENHDKKSCKD